MPMSIGVSRWSDLSETTLAAIQEHAAYKSMDLIDWDEWLRIDNRRFGGFDIPYSVGDVVNDLLEDYCGNRGLGIPYFVPYRFNYNLLPSYPAPREFWFDQLRPTGSQPIMVIEAIWFHTVWRGTEDDAYRQGAYDGARRFNEEYDRVKDAPGEIFVQVYQLAYHYVEVGLIQCLEESLDHNLLTVVYP
jgi:hypothetical protein